MKQMTQVSLAVLVFAKLSTGTLSAQQKWMLRSETEYITGNYGSDIRTEVIYAPLEIRRKFDWGELGVAIPYLWYKSEGTFSFTDPAATPQQQTIPISTSDQGMSDLLFDAIYRVRSQKGNQPEIILRGYWKPPTASVAKGLGTGGHDVLVGTEFWGWLPKSERCFYFGNLYRYFSGGSPGRKADSSWIYEAGVGGLLTSDLLAKISYKEQTSIAPGIPPATSAILETEYKLNPRFKILSGFSVGISEAAPDWKAMLGFEYSF